MKEIILLNYRRTLRTYQKFAARLEKKQNNGTFKVLAVSKQKQLLNRLAKLKAKLMALYHKLTLLGAGAALSTVLATSSVQAQSIPRFELPLNPLSDVSGFPVAFSSGFTGPTIAVADVDNDGDDDVIASDYVGGIRFYKNMRIENGGTLDNNFMEINSGADFPFTNVAPAGFNVIPSFYDVDNDNFPELFLGTDAGTIQFYKNNNGTFEDPANASDNPLRNVAESGSTAAYFADIDGDGAIDAAFVSEGLFYITPNPYGSSIKYFELNSSEGTFGTFNENAAANPITTDFDNFPFVAFSDLDNDGDKDALVSIYGTAPSFLYYQNNSSSGMPQFDLQTDADNPFSETPINLNASPAFLDWDRDGDEDVFLGELSSVGLVGQVRLAQNFGSVDNAQFENVLVTTRRNQAAPFFTNIIGDDQVELFLGNDRGETEFYVNQGNGEFADSSNASINPLLNISVNQNSSIAFANILASDSSEAFVGQADGTIRYYVKGAGDNFSEDIDNNPLSSVSVSAGIPKIAFANLDGDDDQDLFVGAQDGTISFFRNDGGTFTEDAANNPLSGINTGADSFASPAFVDIDDDGDLDLFLGNNFGRNGYSYGEVRFYQNNNGTFAEVTGSADPLDGFETQQFPNPAFTDIDGDGDFDLFIGVRYGEVLSFINNADTSGTPPPPPPTGVTDLIEGRLVIGPNPNQGDFFLKLEDVAATGYKLEVFDAKSVKVYEEEAQGISENFRRDINIPDLETGVYFIRMIIGNQVVVDRLVIEK